MSLSIYIYIYIYTSHIRDCNTLEWIFKAHQRTKIPPQWDPHLQPPVPRDIHHHLVAYRYRQLFYAKDKYTFFGRMCLVNVHPFLFCWLYAFAVFYNGNAVDTCCGKMCWEKKSDFKACWKQKCASFHIITHYVVYLLYPDTHRYKWQLYLPRILSCFAYNS